MRGEWADEVDSVSRGIGEARQGELKELETELRESIAEAGASLGSRVGTLEARFAEQHEGIELRVADLREELGHAMEGQVSRGQVDELRNELEAGVAERVAEVEDGLSARIDEVGIFRVHSLCLVPQQALTIHVQWQRISWSIAECLLHDALGAVRPLVRSPSIWKLARVLQIPKVCAVRSLDLLLPMHADE